MNRTSIEKATVTLTKKGGRGVLTTNNLILTAAHCIAFNCEGGMALGDFYVEDIETAAGEKLNVRPLAVEAVADIAVLGALDDKSFPPHMVKPFDRFCEKTKPVPVCANVLALWSELPVYIYTHQGTWIEATAQLMVRDAGAWRIEAKAPIEGGTSGSPIVNKRGELVGIVSNSPEDLPSPDVGAALLPAALPLWMWSQISRTFAARDQRRLTRLRKAMKVQHAKWNEGNRRRSQRDCWQL